jgi:hypothetical protein
MRTPETQYAKGDNGFVAYQVIGDGPRDLVFIPDWVTNLEVMWEEPSLARFLRRLASQPPDLLRMGPREEGDADCLAFIDRLRKR